MKPSSTIRNYDYKKNHYLCMWDDPNVIEIRTEDSLRWLFEENNANEPKNWHLCGESKTYEDSLESDIDKIFTHLNEWTGLDHLNPYSIMDEDGYVRIYRILRKHISI